MSRAGSTAPPELQAILGELRAYESLTERSPGAFDLGRRHFLHFHETPDGIVADVFLSRGRVRMPATSSAEQAELMAVVDEAVSGVERRTVSKRPRRRRGANRDRGA